MHFEGIIGCFVLLYLPLCVLVAASFRTYPQLILVALLGAFTSYSSLLVTGIFYTVLQALLPHEKTSLVAYVVVLVNTVISTVFRGVCVLVIYRVECAARRYGQTVAKSSFRFAIISAAVGCGMGSVSSLRGSGTLLDATQRLTFYTDGTTLYDFSVCPRMPLLQHSVLQASLLLVCHIAWSVMTGQGMVAVMIRRDQRKLAASSSPNPSFSAEVYPCEAPMKAAGDVALEGREVPLPGANRDEHDPADTGGCEAYGNKMHPATDAAGNDPSTRGVHAESHHPGFLQREEQHSSDRPVCEPPSGQLPVGKDSLMSCGEVNGGDNAEAAAEVHNKTPLLPCKLQEPTVLHKAPSVAVASVVGASVLQFAFAFSSLLNSGAYNYATMEEVPYRGCATSLPFQILITTASLGAMWRLLKNECWGTIPSTTEC
uniref:Uncharacterized protein n=1 Tax=Trypanosoma congolense (strain IL3000) TaxID=1068625 RepID=G0UN79_TRYCI|nr:conserved hypothetical protein [Trypanosoma congolense IL3000]